MIASRITFNIITWNVNGFEHLAVFTELDNLSHIRDEKKIIKTEREFMYSRINNNLSSFSASKSDVNFYLIKSHHVSSKKLGDFLLEKKGILVRDCSNFTGLKDKNMSIRVAVKTHSENLELFDSLESIDK
jgi:threonine-phosphate decarboxylase